MEKKKIEELMKPRYKVIADFWHNPFDVGQVIHLTHKEHSGYGKDDWATDYIGDEEKGGQYSIYEFIPYPHLFKRLEWWEDRKPEEMPEYVKHKVTGRIEKVNQYQVLNSGFLVCYLLHETMWGNEVDPATQAEYETFKSK